jgi:hypothetical protein
MTADGAIDQEKFTTFMQSAQRVNSIWLPIIEKASTDCFTMTNCK